MCIWFVNMRFQVKHLTFHATTLHDQALQAALTAHIRAPSHHVILCVVYRCSQGHMVQAHIRGY